MCFKRVGGCWLLPWLHSDMYIRPEQTALHNTLLPCDLPAPPFYVEECKWNADVGSSSGPALTERIRTLPETAPAKTEAVFPTVQITDDLGGLAARL